MKMLNLRLCKRYVAYNVTANMLPQCVFTMHFRDAIGSARSTGYEKVRSIPVSLSDTVVFLPGAILIHLY